MLIQALFIALLSKLVPEMLCDADMQSDDGGVALYELVVLIELFDDLLETHFGFQIHFP